MSDAGQPDEKWRIGTSWGIHVYQGEKGSPGERPVATFHDPADAQRAVDAVNGGNLHAREFAAEELFVLASRLVSQDVEDMRVYDEIRALRDALTDTTGDPA